jgi:hypothetical protein
MDNIVVHDQEENENDTTDGQIIYRGDGEGSSAQLKIPK